jgi:hypothetical protein
MPRVATVNGKDLIRKRLHFHYRTHKERNVKIEALCCDVLTSRIGPKRTFMLTSCDVRF